ncbi:MAG: preprotein translocase subunit YajC [Actinobacteria bacterium 13_2_20CM_2_71_6]|nr:MAG: preprotein translocase subunit YajC [Actinobacteria bacterium 13_2_20CM_2_71_6]
MSLAASGSSGSFFPLLLFILVPLGMYFLMIRPQQRKQRELQKMQTSLQPGAEVMTGSGIYGTVVEIDEEDGTVVLEISSEVNVRFARGAIARVTPVPSSAPEDAVDDVDEVDHETDTKTPQVIERKD